MHAWLCENPVGVEALNWKEIPTPVPQSGQVLIRIEAASLNFPDLLIVQNKYQMKNIDELINGINDFIEGQEEIVGSTGSLSDLLEDIALVSELKQMALKSLAARLITSFSPEVMNKMSPFCGNWFNPKTYPSRRSPA